MASLGLTESSESLFRALTDRAPVGVFVTDAAGEAVYCNAFALELSGLTWGQSLGFGWASALHPEDAAAVQEAWIAAAAGGPRFSLEYRFRRPDGRVSWVAGTASDVRDHDGALLGWVGVCVDITERKRGEERLKGMFEHARDAVYTLDMHGRFTSVNAAAGELTGYTKEELLQMGILDLVPPHGLDRARAILTKRLRGDLHGVSEAELVTKDGRSVFVEISGRLVFEDGTPVGIEAIARDTTERRMLQERLEYQAFHDSLTGLPNRALLLDRLRQALARTARTGSKVAVMLMDVDNFKLVNDTLGHAAGDELLVAIAPRLAASIRESDTVARLGGDEFAIVLEDFADERFAITAADRIVAAFEQPLRTAHGDERVSASLGIVVAEPGDDADTLLRNADTAMYAAKANAKGGFELYDERRRLRMVREAEVTHALAEALACGGIGVHYQPIVSLSDGRVLAVEALARWKHAEWGWVSPEEFVPIAERNGLVGALGQFILDRVARQMAEWRRRHAWSMPLGAFVNVSPYELAAPEFVERFMQILGRHGLGAGDIGIEVTEGVLIDETAGTVIENLAELSRRDVQLSLDDFGTGYSALASLKRFPFKILKVDRFFIGSIEVSSDPAPITSSVVALGRTLGMTVVAEGIESNAQVELLRRVGCDAGQGYLLARPQPADQLTELLRATGGRIAPGGAGRRRSAA